MSKAKLIFFHEVLGFCSIALSAGAFVMGAAVVGWVILVLSQVFFTHADVLRL